jgi:GT2 family glycosyltransferase
MSISIIIVNYKTPGLLVDCLRTVFTGRETIPTEVIVVDNASGDNSREIVTTAFPQVKWIQLTYNAGFARGNNAGIRQATGDVILLLNSDTLNVDNAIENCYRKFMASDYAACGVQLLYGDGSPQISGNYFMVGGINYLLLLPYLGGFIKWLGELVKVKKPNLPDSNAPVEVDWINGAFLMVKRTAIEKAGLLDEDFFLYAEEAEWCSRFRKLVHIRTIQAHSPAGRNRKRNFWLIGQELQQYVRPQGAADHAVEYGSYSQTVWRRLVFVSNGRVYLQYSCFLHLQFFR